MSCNRIKAATWVRISLSVDPEVWRKFKAKAQEEGEKNISALVESLILCYSYDTCEECPAYQEAPEEEKATVTGKVGVGKWITEKEN